MTHAPLLKRLIIISIGMFAFAFALVPLYDVFCDLTGLNGKPSLEQAQQGKRVVNVYQSSTAFLAGCRIGDLVLRVEGQDAAKMSQGEIIAMIDRQLRG